MTTDAVRRMVWSLAGPFLVALVGGAVADAAGVPLPWMLGAGLVTGLLAASGWPVAAPRVMGRVGQMVVGAGIGLQISPAVAGRIVDWLGLMVGAAVFGLLVACLVSLVFARLAQVKAATAFFALLPGGVAEMANVGTRHGADPVAVAVVQAMRVALVVLVLPATLVGLTPDPLLPGFAVDEALAPDGLAIAFAAALAGAFLAQMGRLPNAWLLGPLLAVGMAAGLGLIEARMPGVLVGLAQALLGFVLGARFQREKLRQVPRVAVVALPVLGALGLVMALAALAVAPLVTLSDTTLVLGFGIGGMAEMILTAKALGEDPALVTAFQAVRAALVNGAAVALWLAVRHWPAFRDGPVRPTPMNDRS